MSRSTLDLLLLATVKSKPTQNKRSYLIFLHFFSKLRELQLIKRSTGYLKKYLLNTQAGLCTSIYFPRCSSIFFLFFSELASIQCSILQLMQLLDRLLAGVSPQDLKDYESYVQLHLKQILTTINKNKLEDMTDIKIKKYECYVNCYEYYGQEEGEGSLPQRIQQLRSCKQKCGNEQKQVQKFLDNINFYSKQKFQGCSQSCTKGTDQEKNICLWECYNRLDRRYKQYWAKQRTGVQARHTI